MGFLAGLSATGTIIDNDGGSPPPATAPDLTVDSVSVSSASVVEGASFTINATVNNEGDAASAATTLTYYRSADATITTGDTSIATDAVGALAASGSSTQDASVSIATAGTYHVGACVPTVSGETDTDNNCSTGVQVTVTAAVAPQITTQPTDQSVTVGENATFTVAATGTPTPTYQWRFEGSDISGATSASYTLSNAALTNAGDYTVVVTNTAGTVTSSAATLTVTLAAVAPQITTQPTDQSVTVGENATFTVAATGTPTPTYQWRFEGSDISGATSASYTLSNAALTNAGDYTVVVTNTAGTVTSSAATLTVTAAAVAPQITTQPTDQSVTVGENATFTVTATGTPTPTYQWRFEGSDISGATSASYTLSNAALTNAGDYTVVVTNTAGTVTSSAATLTVTAAAAPDLTVDDVSVSSASVVEGASFTINATVNNEGDAASAATTLTYYRSADATITTGDTSIATDAVGALAASGSSTQDASVSIATAGTYHVGACVPTVSGETDTDNNCSTGVEVTVTAAAVAPQITTQPTDQSVTVGENATFTVTATGTPTPTYQWRFEGSDISGATSASYTLSNAALTNAGDYTVVVTNTAGTVTSSAATLTVTAAAVAPQITTQPTDQSVTVGENATFTVTATGTPTPTYQWSFEGTEISGATSASYTLSNAALTNAGDYTVVVTNTAGTVTSSAATLTVTAAAVAPQITTQPTDQSVTVGENATFTVAATGTPTPTYQWRFEGTDISGATSASYTLSNAALTNAGDYTVVVTNTAGTVTSSAATLTVTAAAVAPQITTQPTDQSVTVGATATFTVTATGTPTPTYQWRFEGSDISGATSASYTLSNAALTNAGDYTVVVTNTAGTVTSSAATLTVTAAAVAPQITTQPTDQSVTVGENATFTVAATGTPTPTYQWRFEGSDISGATSASYTLSGAALTDAGDYTVVVTNTAGTVTSSAATLTVTPAAVAPQITTQPTDQSVTVGENATFTVAATGTPTPTYQWRFEGSDISGATSASYTLSGAALTDAGDYTVVVTNTAGTVTSSAATLTVTAAAVAPQITTQPTDQSVTVGGNATFTVAATGTPTPTYQWRFEGSDISGATSASYTLSGAALTNAGDYTVVVTNTAGTVTSSAATLTVTPAAVAPQITTQPTDQSVTVGGNATFTVAATGTPTPTYQWRFEGSDIAGATSASYTLSNAALTNAGDYTVVVTNTAGTVTSSAATLTVTPAAVAPQITTQPTDQSVTVGGNATFTVAATGTPTPTYQWRFEGSDISGATSASYTLSNAALTNAGDYTVVVTNTAGTVTSSAATLTVTAAAVAPQITTQPTDQSVTVGGNATFTVAATGTPTPTYQWRFEGSDIAGATSATYTLSGAALTDAGDYTVVVTNTAGTVTSSAATLTVTAAAPDLTVGSVSVSSASVVEGAAFTINATVNNGGNAASAATTLTYYRSADATITTGDTSIGTDSVGALAASGSSPQNISVSIATAGTYYVGACVPTVSGETDTDNNCSTGVQVVVTAAGSPPTVTIGIANASATEGDDIRFTVTLSAQLLEARTLNISYTAGSGNTGAELGDLGSGRPTTLTLPTGTTRVNLDVPTVDDTTDENNETFTVTLSLPDPLPDDPMNTLNITTGTATGTITDDDTPDAEVSISNASVAENVSGGNAEFTVSLNRAVDSPVTLAVAYADGTASLATDLGSGRPDTVTINANATEATLLVPVTNDAIVERNETFTATISEGATPLPDDVSIGTSEATGTITDADTASVSLSSTAPPPASEGGTITFTVELDNPVAERFSLGWAASNGTATVADDLDDQTGTVEIAANARTATFSIPITNDDDTESSETFTVALTGAPTGLVNIAPSRVTVDRSSATGTINASDTGDGNTINIGNRTVAENVAGGSIGFTVSLDRAAGSAVTLAVAYTAGTATLADDLRTPRPATVTINANTTSATLAVPIANETLVEGDETFTVTLSEDPANPLPEGVEIGNGTATGTIANDDESEIVTTVADVDEAGASLRFRPGVTAPLAQDLVLAWEVTGGTASAADFSEYVSSGTVTIPARQATATIFFFPRDDDAVEGSETLTLTFSPAPGTSLPDGVTFRRTTATATIRDSDEAVIDLKVVADVSETDARLTFRPELNRRLTQDVTVAWEVTGGTASAADFSEYVSSGTVTIEAGRGGAPIRFMPLDDDAVEGAETLEVTISVDPATPLPRGVNLGTTTAAATIADGDEPPPVVNATVSIDDESVVENVSGGNATFTAALTTAVDSPVVLAVAVTAGTATLGVDLGAGLPTTVTIDQGQTSATFTVPVTDDNTVEGNETFTVTLSESDTTGLPDGVTIRDGTATGTITENDTAEVTLTANTATANENGGTFSYTVNLSAAADEAVVVRWTATDGTAIVANDLQATTNTVTFAANTRTAQTFTISPVNDNEDEDNETFTVTLEVDGDNPLPTGVNIGADNSSTATITDDDEPPENARAGIADATAVEDADAIGFTVSLSRAVGSDVTLAVAYAAGSADPGTDLGTPLPPTVTIPEGETSTTLAVPVFDDDIAEGDETFTATLGEDPANPLPDDVDIGDGVATGTITDNEEPLVLTAAIRIADAAPAAEDGIARFTITLEPGALSRDALLAVAYAPGTATGGTPPAMPDDDLGRDRPATVTIPAGSRTVVLEVPINDDEAVEDDESFTVTLSAAAEQPNDPDTGRPPEFVLSFPRAEATGTITDNDEAPPPAPGPSALTAPRLIAAGTALRRHANHIDDLTGTVARSRLDGRRTRRLSASPDLGAGALATGGKLGESRRGAWIDGTWAGFGGTASGRQVDVYSGVDYLAPDGGWLVGALIGYEVADLEIGETAYKADYTHLGIYGGARLAERLLFDASATHGAATPDIALGDVSASYNARRLTLRSALTGDFGLEFGLRTGSVTVRPRLGLLYSREQLRAFTDSAGGVAERTTLELGRFSAGPRLTWAFDGGQVAGGARLQWDFLQLDDGGGERISGAADIGVKFDLTPNATLGVHGHVDGIGVSDEFGSLGGGIDLDVRF